MLPNKCNICKDPIHLYQPYYTVKITRHIGGVGVKPNEVIALCPSCFHAYENFLFEQTVHENHQKFMNELNKLKGV